LRLSRQISNAAPVAIAIAAVVAGCAPKVLVLVDPAAITCPDGGSISGAGCAPCPDGGSIGGTAGCVPGGLSDGLVGYWRLDDGTGSRIARDSSTNGNDGVLAYLDPAAVWIAGHAAGGLAVEADGFVSVVPSPSIDSITDQVTIAGWGYLEGTIMDYATIASREDGTTIDQHYHLSVNSRGEVPALWLKTETGTMLLQGPDAVARQTWIHLAGTYDGTTARLYIDGKLVTALPYTGRFMADTTPFILGGNGNGAGDTNVSERFPGRIDEIMLYRRALSAAEIAQLHDGVLFAPPATRDGGARDSQQD
jgi:hypothetical protein